METVTLEMTMVRQLNAHFPTYFSLVHTPTYQNNVSGGNNGNSNTGSFNGNKNGNLNTGDANGSDNGSDNIGSANGNKNGRRL